MAKKKLSIILIIAFLKIKSNSKESGGRHKARLGCAFGLSLLLFGTAFHALKMARGTRPTLLVAQS
jgi:hypothetical protein